MTQTPHNTAFGDAINLGLDDRVLAEAVNRFGETILEPAVAAVNDHNLSVESVQSLLRSAAPELLKILVEVLTAASAPEGLSSPERLRALIRSILEAHGPKALEKLAVLIESSPAINAVVRQLVATGLRQLGPGVLSMALKALA